MTAEQFQLIALLINLGVVTVQKVRDALHMSADDDATLAAILAETDRRIAARRAEP